MTKLSPTHRRKADGSLRRCIVTGRELPPEKLIRFVLDPDAHVVVDVDERLPGRGFWLSPQRDVVNTAVVKRLFAKAARAKAETPEDLADRVEALLATRCRRLIGMARRAGRAVAGFEKVRAGLNSGGGGLVLVASDAAPDSERKMKGLIGDVPVVKPLTGSELAEAFGHDRSVHVLIDRGRLAADIGNVAEKLAGFRTDIGSEQKEITQPDPMGSGATQRSDGHD